MKIVAVFVVGCALAGFAFTQDTAQEEKPLAEQGYLGLAVRDIASGHTVVSWIYPGPLQGEGISAPATDLYRPDLLVAVDGQALNEETYPLYIRSLAPGTTVVLELRKSKQRSGTLPDGLNHEEEIRTLEVVLESRDEWVGTIHRGRGHEGAVVLPGERMLDLGSQNNLVGSAIDHLELTAPVAKLTDVFADYLAENDDFHSLSRVRAPFEDPFCLPELEALVTTGTHDVPGHPTTAAMNLVLDNLDLDRSASTPDLDGSLTLEFFPCVVAAGGFITPGNRLPEDLVQKSFAADCLSFLRVPRSTFYLAGEDTKRHVRVIRRSMEVDWDDLAAEFANFVTSAAWCEPEVPEDIKPIRMDAWGPMKQAVEGEVLHLSNYRGEGWVVIGGAGRNRYDTSKFLVIIDVGGDDEYYASALRLGNQFIVDVAGDDVYTGTPDQGPAGALLGVCVIDDRAGNDRYEGEMLSCGAAMFGMSLLLDRGGNDVYIGTEWSMGAACYGAGMLFDLGQGDDQYLGDFLCEGVGGPRGFGCIVDEGGRDLYRANGPTPSAYGTAAVYQSFSQGMGFGYRQYAAGGIGMISDLGGDDRYEAGEFAQGGAYYWGLGILHDAAGNDLYYGNRYGQGFGVHQAAGMLVDDAGDDTYWSMTAASQGAAWDIGVGMLLDRAGNDSYQCDGLGQGGASMQAIAYLLDLDGTDRYVARGGGIQGGVGGNSYHFHETGAFSFAMLLDLGGDVDHYSTGLENNQVVDGGALNENDPQGSTLHGLFIDH